METFLAASRATPDFKQDIQTFVSGDADVPSISISGFAPRVKVERVLMQLLAVEPELAIEEVEIDGRSGCSDFTGEVTVRTSEGAHVFAFTWCCRWRAEQEGWTDYFGFPDQMRAAREFGWRCFSRWERASLGTGSDAASASLALQD